MSTSKVVTVFPRKSQLSVVTSPPGLGVVLDSVPVSTPRTFTGVEGFQRELTALERAVDSDGSPLEFAGWSDGKSIRHVITTPEDDTTYTATYRPSQKFTAKYYDNRSFSGAPALTRQDPTINFAWGHGSPDPSVPADDFSVRWTKPQWFRAGRYAFTAVADDGVRLYIDGKRVIDQWRGPANTEFTHVADLGEGTHTIQMDYVEYGGDATAALSWDSVLDQPSSAYRAQYWNMSPGVNAIPGTTAELARDEDELDHDWGTGSPGESIGAQRFAARWTRTLNLAPGDYEFAVTADDGVRLYVDGVRVIDKWIDQAPTTYRTTLPMDGGPHKVVMEYYQNGGGALARLAYHFAGDPPGETPWHAEYWNTPDAVGAPSIPTGPADLVRDDDTLDFDWGNGSPASAIAVDRFVARWTKAVVLSAGVYRFTGVRDDGIRAYIDNVPVVDRWTLAEEEYSVDKVVTGGPHQLRVEYFEAGGGARAGFSYDRIGEVVTGDGGYAAEYFDNRNLAGTPVLTRTDDAIDFDWGGGTPGDGVPVDNFSARWSKAVNVSEAGVYKFTVTGDDGVRLFVDGQNVVDKWNPQGATTYTANRELTQGTHQIVLEYFEAGGGAVAKFAYERTSEPAPPPPPPPDPFAAEYFANTTLSGDPVLTRTDDAIDFDWGDGAPNFVLPFDRFSARWTRTKSYAAGTYRFSVTGDDGIRVLVDGAQVVDGWFYQAPKTYTADVPLTEGQHTVVVEYFEHTGGAVAKYSEAKLADEPPLQALSTEASADLTLSAPFGARPDPVIQAVRRLSPTGQAICLLRHRAQQKRPRRHHRHHRRHAHQRQDASGRSTR